MAIKAETNTHLVDVYIDGEPGLTIWASHLDELIESLNRVKALLDSRKERKQETP